MSLMHRLPWSQHGQHGWSFCLLWTFNLSVSIEACADAPTMADSAGRKWGCLVRCLALTETPNAQGKCFRGSRVCSSRPSYTFGFFHLKSEQCCNTSNLNCECERTAGLFHTWGKGAASLNTPPHLLIAVFPPSGLLPSLHLRNDSGSFRGKVKSSSWPIDQQIERWFYFPLHNRLLVWSLPGFRRPCTSPSCKDRVHPDIKFESKQTSRLPAIDPLYRQYSPDTINRFWPLRAAGFVKMSLQIAAFGHLWVCCETGHRIDDSLDLLGRLCFSYCCKVQIPSHYTHCRECRNVHFLHTCGWTINGEMSLRCRCVCKVSFCCRNDGRLDGSGWQASV